MVESNRVICLGLKDLFKIHFYRIDREVQMRTSAYLERSLGLAIVNMHQLNISCQDLYHPQSEDIWLKSLLGEQEDFC